jgi:NitT/TauT family transport system permease protein
VTAADTVASGNDGWARSWRRAWHIIQRWYSIPLLLTVWQLAVSAGILQSRLLPSPLAIGAVFLAQLSAGVLTYHAGVTFSRALAGFTLAMVSGLPFALAMARSAVWRNLFEPVFFVGYPVPKIALFPIFTYVFGFGSPSMVSFTALECLYPIVVTAYFAFGGVRSQLIWTAQNFGAGRATVLRRVVLPAALPGIFTGLRVALPLSIIIVVLIEMLGGSSGLGYYINIWSTRFAFANVYAGILMVGICGFVLDQILLLVRRLVVYWQV